VQRVHLLLEQRQKHSWCGFYSVAPVKPHRSLGSRGYHCVWCGLQRVCCYAQDCFELVLRASYRVEVFGCSRDTLVVMSRIFVCVSDTCRFKRLHVK
jgi:hypothetical protein